MIDRRARCRTRRRDLIEPLVEDRSDRAVGARADIERARTRRLDALAPEASGHAHDAQTRPEALFGMTALDEYLLAQERRARPDRGGVRRDALDGPVGKAPVRGWHVIRD